MFVLFNSIGTSFAILGRIGAAHTVFEAASTVGIINQTGDQNQNLSTLTSGAAAEGIARTLEPGKIQIALDDRRALHDTDELAKPITTA